MSTGSSDTVSRTTSVKHLTEAPMDRALHPRIESAHGVVMALKFREFGIPVRFRNLRLADFEPRDLHQRRALTAAESLVENFRDHYVSERRPLDNYPEDRSLMGRGLLLIGPPGTGKTRLGALTLMEVMLRYALPVHFFAWADYISARQEVFSLDGRDDEGSKQRLWEVASRIERSVDSPLLLLDDVGQEHRGRTGFSPNEFARVIRERHSASKPTIVTSNLSPDKWTEVMGEATASFVREAFDILPLTGGDHRAGR